MIHKNFRLAGRGWRIALGAVLLAGAGACNADKLTHLNTDPNNPTSAPPQPVFTYAV